MQIGPIRLTNRLILAPMAGVTDRPFRQLCRRLGAGLAVSEMVAADPSLWGSRKSRQRLDHSGEVGPIAVQIVGADPQALAEAARFNGDLGADVIDINMGCPSKSVTSGLCGSALMREPDHAMRLVEATVNATKLPVTLKMRLGWDHNSLNAADMAKCAEDAGVRMLTVHGRTRQQFFRGAADWSAIAPVVRKVRIPVIANGDIGAAADARRALELSGAAGVMIGRAAQGRPWLPAAIERALKRGGEICPPSRARLLESLLTLCDDTLAFYDGALGVRVARKHIAWMIDSEFGAAARAIRKQICMLEDPRRVREALIQLFDDESDRAAA